MREITVQASTHDYQITLGEAIRFQLQDHLKRDYSMIMIITDETVASLYLADVKANFKKSQLVEYIIPVGEASKSMAVYAELQTAAIKAGLDRHSLIIALGGGVVGDLAGFVAATFLRGIDYIQVPTTILAHDSSVGGKVAINHELGKNLIGCFYPPQAVIYDVKTLETLTAEHVRSGYAELIKEALIADEVLFEDIVTTDLTEISNKVLTDHLYKCIQIKADIVEADERESGMRMYLNLGHTLAHAIEAELGYGEVTHGEAVAIGLLFALHVSEIKHGNKLPYDQLYQWLQQNDFPITLFQLDHEKLIAKMQHDKKTVDKKVKMVLLKQIGEPIVTDLTNDELHYYLHTFKEKVVAK